MPNLGMPQVIEVPRLGQEVGGDSSVESAEKASRPTRLQTGRHDFALALNDRCMAAIRDITHSLLVENLSEQLMKRRSAAETPFW